MVTLFSENELKAIEKRIGELEARTSGEIVVVVRKSSDPYSRVNWALSIMGGTLASLLFLSLSSWHLSVVNLLEWQILGVVAFWLFGQVRPLKRRLLAKQWIAFRVHREAMATFLEFGLHHTREETGILIYLSQLERRVEILADRGIHQKVGEQFWQARVAEIVDGIHAGKAFTAFIASLNVIGEELAKHFPPGPDNPNELPNAIR